MASTLVLDDAPVDVEVSLAFASALVGEVVACAEAFALTAEGVVLLSAAATMDREIRREIATTMAAKNTYIEPPRFCIAS